MSPLPPCVTQICGLAVSAGLLASLMLSASSAQIVLPPGLGAPGGGQTVPTAGYDLALLTLASGDFTAALQIASEEYQGSVKAGAQRWIDSIAAAAAAPRAAFWTILPALIPLSTFSEVVTILEVPLIATRLPVANTSSLAKN